MSPDNRQHRGSHPHDVDSFSPDKVAVLRRATSELSWLLSRGYANTASLKLVGDRYALTQRQRLAIARAACSDASLEKRARSRRGVEGVEGEDLIIDGFNLIITVEAALGGGLLLVCRDDCIRDLSSVHGSYRSVQETESAIGLIGEALATLKPAAAEWLFDRPVSNSGRLARRVGELAFAGGWDWTVEVVFNPDEEIRRRKKIAVTSDSAILDRADAWINLNRYLVERYLPQSRLMDLRE